MIRFIIYIAAIVVFPVDLCFPTRSTQIIVPQSEISEQEIQTVSTVSPSTSSSTTTIPPTEETQTDSNLPVIEKCEDGWTYYKRATTGWCMKIVSVSDLSMTEPDGVAACAELGAVLSSVDDSAMKDVIDNLRAAANIQDTTWLGGILKDECMADKCEKYTLEYYCKLTETCGNNRYLWDDGYTTTQSDEYLVEQIKNIVEIIAGYYINPYTVMCIYEGAIAGCNPIEDANSALCGKLPI